MGIYFFDKIFVINLDSRPDRLAVCDAQMKEYGIEYERFPAIQDDFGVKGLVLTMRKLFRHCLDEGYQNILVLEDDFGWLAPPVAFLNYVIPQLPKDYKLFYLGLNLLAPTKRVSENILKVEDCYSTHSVAYSKSGMETVMEFLETEPIQPYDSFLRKWVLPEKCFATFPMLCTQLPGYSDIEKSSPAWGELMAKTFAMYTKNI